MEVIYAILSVFIVSLISLIGILTIGIKTEKLKKFLIYMISFSAGAMLGDVFLHLIPHLIEEGHYEHSTGLWVLVGIVLSLILEKIIHWRHCHMPQEKGHIHHVGIMSLIGDAMHNFIDGIIIGISYLVSIPVGIATTIAVIFHEIPQEIADYGVLIYSGFSKTKALAMNFLTACSAFIGLGIALILGSSSESIAHLLIPIAAGNFIYIAGSDLIPELHKEKALKSALLQIIFFVLGVGVMLALVLLETH